MRIESQCIDAVVSGALSLQVSFIDLTCVIEIKHNLALDYKLFPILFYIIHILHYI